MYNTTKLAYQVSEDDVTRARNQVGFYFDLMISCLDNWRWQQNLAYAFYYEALAVFVVEETTKVNFVFAFD